jgi:hypothetical protein
MSNNKTSEALQKTIEYFELEHETQKALLKEQFHHTFESIKPVNMLKEAVQDLRKSPEKLEDIVVPLLGLGTGYLTKRLIAGKSEDPTRQALADAVSTTIASLIVQHPHEVMAAGRFILELFKGKPKGNEAED